MAKNPILSLTPYVCHLFIAVRSGNPKLAGIYLQVSYAVLSAVSIFVFLAWNLTEKVWTWFGSDPDISKMAGYYARVLSFAIPGMIGFNQVRAVG
mmetsp:Transcript_14773/g.27676  ORF Transcript_14773/g.27676 Transcript_14773/m.27676 type:complete len:95 (+) Transcript_14773:599-883(+)